ncbi:hypothetical protein PHMEG_00023773 [Phytophthora megakarya]|uniref:Uncharacterized protein n=1 Tax=Phytophthora megakarya TaxID=4795 RepID=A0A225VFK3_9STRA|nr:hypothetical protein PHMEG_00023773 [Phytophthora megakarya]
MEKHSLAVKTSHSEPSQTGDILLEYANTLLVVVMFQAPRSKIHCAVHSELVFACCASPRRTELDVSAFTTPAGPATRSSKRLTRASKMDLVSSLGTSFDLTGKWLISAVHGESCVNKVSANGQVAGSPSGKSDNAGSSDVFTRRSE